MTSIKLSYAITVCNEKKEVKRLIDFLLSKKRPKDEIVVLFDQKNGDEEVAKMLTKFNKLPNFQFWRGNFKGDFALWKNQLNEYCEGTHIFQIDADEIPSEFLIENLPAIIESNPDNHVYFVPRVNTVEGLTQEHINKWRWNVDNKGWVNWPDYQQRIYLKNSRIKWKNKVHEVLSGYEFYAPLPADESYALFHPKDIKRQEKQNELYATLS